MGRAKSHRHVVAQTLNVSYVARTLNVSCVARKSMRRTRNASRAPRPWGRSIRSVTCRARPVSACADGVHGYADNAGPQHAAVKYVAVLEDLDDGAVGIVRSFHALDGLVEMRIEGSALRSDALDPVLGQGVPQLPINNFQALAVFLIRRIIMSFKSTVEGIEHRKELADQPADAAAVLFLALALDAFAVILETGLAPDQRLHQLVLFGFEARQLRGQGAGRRLRGVGHIGRLRRGVRIRGRARAAVKFDDDLLRFFGVLVGTLFGSGGVGVVPAFVVVRSVAAHKISSGSA